MKKVLGLLTGLYLVGFSGNAVAQNYDYCYDSDRDRYWVGEIYEYGHGYPVPLRDLDSYPIYPSRMSFDGTATMYSFTEEREVMMVDGEEVFINGFYMMDDCSMQLLVYSPRLRLVGGVPAETVLLP